MKEVIVTGANGFIGSSVTRYLVSQDIKVLAICREKHDKNIPLSPLITKKYADLKDIKKIADDIQFGQYDTFYHFAWEGSAGAARADTALQLSNAQWSLDALMLSHSIGCKRFVGAGSIMEHETMAAAYKQGNKPGLGYIYGGGKLVAHVMSMSLAAQLGIELVWGSITNAYGVGEFSPRMVNTTIRKCIANVSPEFTSGVQNYDFVYIDDVARAFYLIATKGKPFHEYLIGSSTAQPLKDFLLEMKEAIAPNLAFTFGKVPFTGINLPLSAFDCSETERDTGFKARISFAEGTKMTMEWIKSKGHE